MALFSDLHTESLFRFNYPIDLLGFRNISILGRVNPLCEMLYFEIPIYLLDSFVQNRILGLNHLARLWVREIIFLRCCTPCGVGVIEI